MKKRIALLLALVMVLGMVGCGGKQTARKQLNKQEEQLVTALIKITTADFYEPSKIRVLEIGTYENRTRFEGDPDHVEEYGPDTVVVRLQGENRVGGTLNHLYLLVLVGAENKSEKAQERLEKLEQLGPGYENNIMTLRGEVGDYVQIADSNKLKDKEHAEEVFNIGKVNKALAEYWEERGF